MIQEDKQGLEDVLRNDDTLRRTQQIEDNLRRQEEVWRAKEQIRKSEEESE